MPPLLAALPVIASVASVAGGVVGAVGAVQSGEANAAAAQTNSNIMTYNAQVADRNREATLLAADSDAQKQTRDNARQLGAIRVAYGASGLSMAGSPLEQLGDTAMQMQQDTDATLYKGQLKADAYTDEGNTDRMQAGLDLMQASNDRNAEGISMTSQLLGGISSAGSSLLKAK